MAQENSHLNTFFFFLSGCFLSFTHPAHSSAETTSGCGRSPEAGFTVGNTWAAESAKHKPTLFLGWHSLEPGFGGKEDTLCSIKTSRCAVPTSCHHVAVTDAIVQLQQLGTLLPESHCWAAALQVRDRLLAPSASSLPASNRKQKTAHFVSEISLSPLTQILNIPQTSNVL